MASAAKQARQAARRNPTTTTTTTANIPKGAQSLSDRGVELIKGFTPPQAPENAADYVAPFNATQLAAQQAALAGVPAQQAQVSAAAASNAHLMNKDILDPSSNPALQNWINTSTRPLVEQYNEEIMPAIGSGAADVGQFGSSKHGIAQGLAARGLSNATGDVTANIANQGYSQGLQTMLAATGMAPQIAAAQNIPAATIGAVGDVQQGQAQMGLDATRDAKWLNKMMPFYFGQDLIGTAGAVPGGSTTVAQQAPRTGPLASLLGGAVSGATVAPGHPLIGAAIGGLTGLGGYFAGG